jgi:hypothetical protein
MVLTLLDKRRVSYKDETKQIKESLEEEKLILTTQVNSYARQGDDLKRTLSHVQDRCKLLEDQLIEKTKIEVRNVKRDLI